MTIRVTVQNDEPTGSNRPAIGVSIVDKDDPNRVVQPEVLVPPGAAITFFLWHSVQFIAREVDQAVPQAPAVVGPPQGEQRKVIVPGEKPADRAPHWTPGQDGG